MGQFREFVIELASDAGVEERDALQEPGHMRVFHRVGTHPQARGGGWMLFGELGAEPREIHQLLVVIRQQLVGHYAPPTTEKLWLDGSSSESKLTRSGAGSAYMSASMRKRRVR